MKFERALIVVLLVSQAATGYFMYQQSEAISSLSDSLSFSEFSVNGGIQSLEDEIRIQRNHYISSSSALSERIDRLAHQVRSSDFSILGSFDDVDQTIAKLEKRISSLELTVQPLEYKVSKIDCGETRSNFISAPPDYDVCRWKR